MCSTFFTRLRLLGLLRLTFNRRVLGRELNTLRTETAVDAGVVEALFVLPVGQSRRSLFFALNLLAVGQRFPIARIVQLPKPLREQRRHASIAGRLFVASAFVRLEVFFGAFDTTVYRESRVLDVDATLRQPIALLTHCVNVCCQRRLARIPRCREFRISKSVLFDEGSDLFGHRRCSLTGALRAAVGVHAPGRFAVAAFDDPIKEALSRIALRETLRCRIDPVRPQDLGDLGVIGHVEQDVLTIGLLQRRRVDKACLGVGFCGAWPEDSASDTTYAATQSTADDRSFRKAHAVFGGGDIAPGLRDGSRRLRQLSRALDACAQKGGLYPTRNHPACDLTHPEGSRCDDGLCKSLRPRGAEGEPRVTYLPVLLDLLLRVLTKQAWLRREQHPPKTADDRPDAGGDRRTYCGTGGTGSERRAQLWDRTRYALNNTLNALTERVGF